MDIAQGKRNIIVKNDTEMVNRVANDPYGIGYCSAALVDQKRVVITLPAENCCYPQTSTKYRWNVPDKPTWPWTRTLYAVYGGKAWQADGSGIANVMLAPGGGGTKAMQAGPLFGTGYWKP